MAIKAVASSPNAPLSPVLWFGDNVIIAGWAAVGSVGRFAVFGRMIPGVLIRRR